MLMAELNKNIGRSCNTIISFTSELPIWTLRKKWHHFIFPFIYFILSTPLEGPLEVFTLLKTFVHFRKVKYLGKIMISYDILKISMWTVPLSIIPLTIKLVLLLDYFCLMKIVLRKENICPLYVNRSAVSTCLFKNYSNSEDGVKSPNFESFKKEFYYAEAYIAGLIVAYTRDVKC